MYRKLVCALVVAGVGITFAAAAEFGATESGVSITKIDGNKITFHKTKGFGKKTEKGDAMTLELAKDAKIVKGKFSFDKDAKKAKFEAGDAIEGGLKNEAFAKIDPEKGLNARLTIADDKITQVMLVQFEKKKKTTEE